MKEKLPDWCDRVVDRQPGFMLYADDWQEYSADYDSREIGEMVKAILKVFLTGEITEFPDRGMRQFYRQALKAIEADRRSYVTKCVENAYNRYKGIRGKDSLSFDRWLQEIYKQRLTTVDDRQEPSPNVTKNNTNNQLPETNSQLPIINDQLPENKHNASGKEERENQGESVRGGEEGKTVADLQSQWAYAMSRGDRKTAYDISCELFRKGFNIDPATGELSNR